MSARPSHSKTSPSATAPRLPVVIGVVLVAILLISCSLFGDDAPPPLLPLEPGTQWSATGNASVETASLRILSHQEAVVRIVKSDDRVVSYTLPIRQANDSLLVAWTQAPPSISGRLFFKHPVNVGSTYEYVDTTDGRQRYRISVTEDSVDVPAGTYNCLNYSVKQSGELVARVSVKPGFGPVQVFLREKEYTLSLVDKNQRR